MPTAKTTASAPSVLRVPALLTVLTAVTAVPLSFSTSPVAKVLPVMLAPRLRILSARGRRIFSATLPRHHLMSKSGWCAKVYCTHACQVVWSRGGLDSIGQTHKIECRQHLRCAQLLWRGKHADLHDHT